MIDPQDLLRSTSSNGDLASGRTRSGLGRLRLPRVHPLLESLEPRTLFSIVEPSSILLTGAFGGSPFTISFDKLANSTQLASTPNLSFLITTVPSNGTLLIDDGTTTSVAAAGSQLLANQSLVWTPASTKKGKVNAFSIRATDGLQTGNRATKVKIATTRPAQIVNIATSDGQAVEGTDDQGTIVLTRTGKDLSGILDVPLTVGGTGTLGTDFHLLNGTTEILTTTSLIEFPAGVSSITLTVVAGADNATVDPTLIPTFTLGADSDLSNPAFGVKTASASVSVFDDTPTFTLTPASASIQEGGTSQQAFIITRTLPPGVVPTGPQTLTVNFSGGTFTPANVLGVNQSGVDFTGAGNLLSAEITFDPNVSSQTLFLTTVNNSVAEGNKTIVAQLAADSSFNLGGNGTATLTVLDAAPVVGITPVKTTALESNPTGGAGKFLITRTGDKITSQDVTFTIPNGSSNSHVGTDFIVVSGGTTLLPTASGTLNSFTVTIPAGQSSVPVFIRALDNHLNSNLTVTATLANSTLVNLGTVRTANITITSIVRTPKVLINTFPRIAARNGAFTLSFNDLRRAMGASTASGSHGALQISVVSIALGTLTLVHNGASTAAAAGTLISAGDSIIWTAPANTTIPTRTAATFTAVDGGVTAASNSTMIVTIL
jgi:hypothetical protein